VRAKETAELKLPTAAIAYKSKKDVFLAVTLKLRHTTNWAGAGHVVAWFQHQLQNASTGPLVGSLGPALSKLDVHTSQTDVRIGGSDFSFEFDKTRGFLTSWMVKGQSLLEPDPSTGAAVIPSFWRPPTDNDRPQSLPYWQRFGVDALTSQLRSLAVDSSKLDQVTVKIHIFITPPVLAWGWDCEIDYIVGTSGKLHINVNRFTPTGSFPEHVPRVGFDLRLSKALHGVRWLGRGPGESYPDKKSSQRVGIWKVDSIFDMDTKYDVPQENGNRMDTRWVVLTDSHIQGRGIRARRLDEEDKSLFSFAATWVSHYAIQAAKHPTDLFQDSATLLRLDVGVAGVGTAACGPGVRDDMLVKCKEYKFTFQLESL
jgi:beta-galactosidase